MSIFKVLFCSLVLIQNLLSEARAETELAPIKVESNKDDEVSEASGFSGVPLKNLPLSSKVVNSEEMAAARMQRLADVIQADASATDSYNATGYWDFISVRGFTLENRDNFQREGLPISAETSIPLNNKERVEILKGLGAIQAGVASPGGLVNYVVKRPTQKSFSSFFAEYSGVSNLLVAADSSQRSESGLFGYRLNIAHENLSPNLKNAQGQRSLLSFSSEWRLPESSLLEFEIEWSQRKQQSQAGFSLLGNQLPEPVDPNLNLNNQPWVQPVLFGGLTGTLRYSQFLTSTTHWSAVVGSQSLSTDDRMAYPFGCSAENNYDRFCSDGSFDVYDYRSENERRQVDSAKISLTSRFQTAVGEHNVSLGLLQGTFRERFQKQAYNYVGSGRVDGSIILPENGSLSDESTLRDSTTREIFLTDSVTWEKWQGWLGLRWGNLDRSSVRTDGSRATQYHQSFPLPWMALSYDLGDFFVYSSWGRGIETFVVPNKAGYLSPGEFIPGVESEQVELGFRGGDVDFNWNVAFFSIQRPLVEDQAPYYQVDGKAQHKGVEVQASRSWSVWSLAGSAMLLDAKREGSVLRASLNGLRPTNVPETVLRGKVDYRFSNLKGLSMNLRLSHEGARAILANNSMMLPSWTQWDFGGKYEFSVQKIPTAVTFGIENLTDHKFWRESPTQYGHVYLYPGESRNYFLALQATL